jgi:4a-hydroxytetrahydrobiopterin dehydratase
MHCVPCKGGVPPLTSAEIAPLLAQIDNWQVEDDRKLLKSFKFKNLKQAIDFVNVISEIAEAEGHHPDLYVRWGELRAYIWTHKIDGLTESDFVLAARFDRAYHPPVSP